jgi:hypothetical protein
MRLRLGTWNCRMALDRKRDALERLAADVLVVPECARDCRLGRDPGVSFRWRGSHPKKGLAVFGFNGWTVEPARDPGSLPWTLPVAVRDPQGRRLTTLVAIWTCRPGHDGRPGYARQVTAAVEHWAPRLRRGGAILAGDLNCGPNGSGGPTHRANLERLARSGMVSAYHVHHDFEHGREQDMTLRWVGRGKVVLTYHCDFVFLPGSLAERLEAVEVGRLEHDADLRVSDHAAVMATISLAAAA